MAMLAETRRKQKWTLNPRGKQWSEDSNKFGQKMLEKMGWSSGKGLGAQEQGMTEHVRVKFKDDQSGIGFNKNDQDKQWTQHQESFNNLLMSLQKNQNMEQAEMMETKEISLSGTSLEEKSKQSKARVHYKKFTRGKDVNKYSSKDLANIFGKRTLDEESKYEETVEQEFHAEPVGTEDNTAGILTIKGGNISEYFKNKVSVKKNFDNNDDDDDDDDDEEKKEDDPESDGERYIGFGFGTNAKTDSCDVHFQSVTNYAFENPCLDLNLSSQIKSSSSSSRKRKGCGFDNEGLDLNYPEKNDTPKKSCAEFQVSETHDCFVNPALNLDAPESTTTCNGMAFEVTRDENQESLDNYRKKKKKKKKKKNRRDAEIIETGFVNCALNLDLPDANKHKGMEFEIARFPMGLDNDALDLSDENCVKKRVTFNDCVEYNTDVMKKKKAKTKLDKFEIQTDKIKRKKKRTASDETAGMVFVNEALSVDSDEIQDNELNELNELNERKSRKQKRRKTRRMSNLETIEEAPEENENQDAISERRNTKKEKDIICDVEIITLNDSMETIEAIEESTPKKIKKKKREKIDNNLEMMTNDNVIADHLQVDVEACGTRKRKKKKVQKDKENDKENEISQNVKEEEEEEEEKSVDEEKEKKRRKRKRKSSETCEFFLDLVEENVEIKEQDTLQEKKSRKKRSRDQEINASKEEEEETPKDSTWSKKPRLANQVTDSPQLLSKKSKSVFFKSMFSKPTVVFKGSNINDIKGYGID